MLRSLQSVNLSGGFLSLSDARVLDGETPDLPDGPLYRCTELSPWSGRAFWMPPGDPRLSEIHAGGPSPCDAMDNLSGLVEAWVEHPEWIDFLDPSAPNHADKMLERALYLHHWDLPAEGRVLDLGGGCGRFAAALLDRGLDVEVVDPDLRSLWRTLQHAAGRPGRVDLHWTTGEHLPEIEPVDAVVAAEVLCYVEDPARILENIRRVLRPNGSLFASVEARYGWAMGLDVRAGTLEALVSDGVVHVPGDMWVRTYTEDDLVDLLGDAWEIESVVPTHYIPSGPFESAAGELELDQVIAAEERLRANPVTRPLNRAWMLVARPRG